MSKRREEKFTSTNPTPCYSSLEQYGSFCPPRPIIPPVYVHSVRYPQNIVNLQTEQPKNCNGGYKTY